MCSNFADTFGYGGGSRALDATINKERISLTMRPALAEGLTPEDTVDIQTNFKRAIICPVLQSDPRKRHAISCGTHAVSEYLREYSDYLRLTIFLTPQN
jgi:hypothetical protein